MALRRWGSAQSQLFYHANARKRSPQDTRFPKLGKPDFLHKKCGLWCEMRVQTNDLKSELSRLMSDLNEYDQRHLQRTTTPAESSIHRMIPRRATWCETKPSGCESSIRPEHLQRTITSAGRLSLSAAVSRRSTQCTMKSGGSESANLRPKSCVTNSRAARTLVQPTQTSPQLGWGQSPLRRSSTCSIPRPTRLTDYSRRSLVGVGGGPGTPTRDVKIPGSHRATTVTRTTTPTWTTRTQETPSLSQSIASGASSSVAAVARRGYRHYSLPSPSTSRKSVPAPTERSRRSQIVLNSPVSLRSTSVVPTFASSEIEIIAEPVGESPNSRHSDSGGSDSSFSFRRTLQEARARAHKALRDHFRGIEQCEYTLNTHKNCIPTTQSPVHDRLKKMKERQRGLEEQARRSTTRMMSL